MYKTHSTPPETGPIRADQAPTDAVVELSADCLHNAIETQPALAVRLRELGYDFPSTYANFVWLPLGDGCAGDLHGSVLSLSVCPSCQPPLQGWKTGL